MIQLQSDTLFFIGNFTIFTEIETQSFVAPLVTRKSNQYYPQLTDSLMHLSLVFAENPGTTGGPLLVGVLHSFSFSISSKLHHCLL